MMLAIVLLALTAADSDECPDGHLGVMPNVAQGRKLTVNFPPDLQNDNPATEEFLNANKYDSEGQSNFHAVSHLFIRVFS